MLQHHAFENLGAADHGWLNAKHHFSFCYFVLCHDAGPDCPRSQSLGGINLTDAPPRLRLQDKTNE
jgi:hypothetical protein